MNDLMIDYFMAVATNRSFTRTSEELFVSQPAISKQISQLEKELGFKLFERNNQRTELTPVGRLFYDLFSRYKADLINTKHEAQELLGMTGGTVRVGFLEGWDLFNIIPEMMQRFHSVYPDTEIVINCCGIKELPTSLLTDTIDIIVTMNNSIRQYSDFSASDVARIDKILLYSADHRLAGRTDLALPDFKNDIFFAPWAIVEQHITEAIASYTRPYGFIPELRFVKNHESLITCVRNNMGVAIVDKWVWAKDAQDLRWIQFDAQDIVSICRMKTKNNEKVLFMEQILRDIIHEQEAAKNRADENNL